MTQSTQPHDFPQHAIAGLARLMAMMGRSGATRIYRVSPRAAVAGLSASPPTTFRWRRKGLCLAMYGSTLGATAVEAAGFEARVQLTSQQDLITDGDSFAFASYRALFGDAQNWFPLDRPVADPEDWTVTFNNVTANPITGSLYFALLEAPGQSQ